MRFEAKYLFVALILVSIGFMSYQLGITAYAIHPQNQVNPVQTYLQEHYGVNSVDQLIQKYRQEYMNKYQNYLSQVPSEYLEANGLTSSNAPSIETTNSNGMNLYLLIQTLPILLGIPIGLTYKFSKRENVKKIVLIVGIAGMFFVIGYQVGYVHAQTGQIRIGSGSFTSEASYIIYGDDTNGDGVLDIIYARNGKTGQIDFQGTDIGSVVNKAIASLSASGGKIFLKSGTYMSSTTILINRSNVVLEGAGYELTKIVMADGSNTRPLVINASKQISNIVIRGITIDGNRAGQTGGTRLHGISIINATHVTIEECRIMHTAPTGHDTGGSGISIYHLASYVWILNCRIIDAGDRGIQAGGDQIIIKGNKILTTFDRDISLDIQEEDGVRYIANYVVIEGNTLDNPYGGSNIGASTDATSPRSMYYVVIANNLLLNPHNRGGVYMGASASRYVVIANNIVKSGNRNGLFVSGQHVAVVGNTIAGTGEQGIRVENLEWSVVAGNTIKDVGENGIYVSRLSYCNVISGNVIYNVKKHGILLEPTASGKTISNTVIQGNVIQLVSQGLNNTYSDICLNNTAGGYIHHISIIGNILNEWGDVRAKYGVHILGSPNYITVRGNYIFTPFTNAIKIEGGSNIVIQHNTGFVTEASGVVYPCVNGTVVSHGLAGTPTNIVLTLNGSRTFSDGANTYVLFDPAIIDLNPQNFTIELLCLNQTSGTVIAVTPSLYNATVYWRAEYQP